MTSPTESPTRRTHDGGEHPIIVVGLDHTAESQRALVFAIGVARRAGAQLICVHVRHITMGRLPSDPRLCGIAYQYIGLAERAITDEVAEMVAAAQRDHPEVSITLHNLDGEPGPLLARFTDSIQADQVIVGATRHHIVHALTSVGRNLRQRSHCPLTIVP